MSQNEKLLKFESEETFRPGNFCKVFTLEYPKQSGELLHSHDYYQIWYVMRGQCIHSIEDQQHIMNAGDAFILPPNLIHKTTLMKDSKVRCCEFLMSEQLAAAANISFPKIREITNGISFVMLFQREMQEAKTKFSFSERTQCQIEALLECMQEEYRNEGMFYEDFLQLQLLQLLLLFIREYAEQPTCEPAEELYYRYKGIVEDTIRYVKQSYSEPLTLDSVCKRAMMSKTYFCYLFKLQTQKTFIEYLVDLRIEKATQLLVETDRSITGISQDVGFQSSTHFTRTFRKVTGLTPREYRNRHRQ